ncbi:hypothetical protein [Mycolicibacterium confluentis]|uniref:Uncharacterized protein n=1 Tax=Mycolicibacterium confluentis TaxID=28047 RepID=A0A7I7XRU8_9MYCO|nr:hypothetical protein [Mycolicibacterium confluentis]MCV7318736.1 hypothetical protein [Mycolicibacterium confluentis]ORV23140.1 hypothetical protein AWB99_24845 [Mycolicibacterium confluentis]BBZ31884.1 hypothetical protein MCNF_04890 [Mycolicibacterium confluentis]
MAIRLRGTELRYVLTSILLLYGPMKVSELAEELTRQGFTVDGRPTKTVSDALRWERRRGRVVRLGWGGYGPGAMPRSTEYRIDQRVLALRMAVRKSLLAEQLEGWEEGWRERV